MISSVLGMLVNLQFFRRTSRYLSGIDFCFNSLWAENIHCMILMTVQMLKLFSGVKYGLSDCSVCIWKDYVFCGWLSVLQMSVLSIGCSVLQSSVFLKIFYLASSANSREEWVEISNYNCGYVFFSFEFYWLFPYMF